ncbi:methylmalonyl Co-A mutase-associated GTPase MeaB [Candidatus Poriferisocius sp.]|uniref:methylmalonyl Co-A mutase-associated GTPase MeaB n=1 Tax=Candidatus Poriferisocius sp. TaxID=3101276 RepID=UPI003B024AE1
MNDDLLIELFEAATDGDRRALGKLLTMVERQGDTGAAVSERAGRRAGQARIVGITGAPGTGKSTLTGRLAAICGAARPAILAIDPSSPLTGGAILGDRIRMDNHAGSATFIRSMATRGHAGGLAVAVPDAIRVLDAAGHDPILVETVGVGQVEVAIAAAADTTVVVVTPGWGDAVQANKAGLLEVADVFVVNKADRPDARGARRDLELMLDLGHREHAWRAPIMLTTATEGEGIDNLWTEIQRHTTHLHETGELNRCRHRRHRDELAGRIQLGLRDRVDQILKSEWGEATLEQVDLGETSPATAADQVLAALARTASPPPGVTTTLNPGSHPDKPV